MKVLVDTSVWSLTLRRPVAKRSADENRTAERLTELVEDGRAAIIGPIRQEVLTGIRAAEAYRKLRSTLRAFEDEPLETDDFELAAEFANTCLAAGIAPAAVDLLICAVARRRAWMICSTDRDFTRYAGLLGLSLLDLS